MKKRAFTLAEAILTMTILGIIAAIMIATLKPSQYKQQGYDALKKKVYAELDGITEVFIVECCKDMKATSVFNGCDRTAATHTFGNNSSDNDLAEATIYGRYMRGAVGTAGTANGKCLAKTSYTSIRLKNGACVYFGANSIKVDVNGNQKPDAVGSDQMVLEIGDDGITTDMDTAIGANGTW